MRSSSVATLEAARARATSRSKDNGGRARASPLRVAMTRPKWISISPIRYPTIPGVNADVSGSETRYESSSSVGRTIIDRACLPAGHQALQSGRNGFALLQRHLELTAWRGAVGSQYRRCGAGNQRKHHGRCGSAAQARLDRWRIFLIGENQVRALVLQRAVEVVIV